MSTITLSLEGLEPITPSNLDALLADKTGKRLVKILKEQLVYPVQLLNEGVTGDTLEIPAPAMRLLVEILAEMAKGHTVTLVALQEEISTQQAAEILGVSRPYFVQLLESGAIAFRKVGARRRVRLQDVMSYKRTLYHKRLQTLDELTAYDQELGLQ